MQFSCCYTDTPCHTMSPLLHPQNAPQRFQVVLVATDLKAESASVNLEIARQFAAEKQLELVECDVDEEEQVDKTFLALISRVMRNWEAGDTDGR